MVVIRESSETDWMISATAGSYSTTGMLAVKSIVANPSTVKTTIPPL
jgi:hypothetical protein